MHLSRRDNLRIIALILLFMGGSILGWFLLHEVVLILALTFIFGVSIALQVEIHRRTQQQLWTNYQQVEALFYLFSTLKVRYPLPPMRRWAISPDFATLIISLIWEHKPKLVVELGSGLSTLVAAYCLQQIGEGELISLEHNEQFATASTTQVIKHELQHIATIIYAPLKKVLIRNTAWLWYASEQLPKDRPIDMLIIDGPPGDIQKLARYPALSLLFFQLSEDAVILLDDAFRHDEKEIVTLWLKEFGSFTLEEVDTEKGAAILRRQTLKNTLETQ